MFFRGRNERLVALHIILFFSRTFVNGKEVKTVTISGKLYFSPRLLALPSGSCLRLSAKEDIQCMGIYCSIPDLASQIIPNPITKPDGTFDYMLTIKSDKRPPSLNVGATLNVGWCRNDDEWIRGGDYTTITAHTISVEPGKDDYQLDISLEQYGKPSPPVKHHSPTVKSCNDRVAEVGTGRRLLGAFVPQCDDDGAYKSKQCHYSIGFCWCVNTKTGVEIEGTRRRGALECGAHEITILT